MKYDTRCEFWKIYSKTYIKTVCKKIEKILNIKLKNDASPMETGDHPDMDESDLLDQDFFSQYQILIGGAQWDLNLGQNDFQYATHTMDRFVK